MSHSIRRVQVIKRPGGRSPYWYLRYWEDDPDSGKRRERWKSTATTVRKKAEQQRRDLERRLEQAPETSSEQSWEAFEKVFFDHQQACKPATTVEFYRNSLRLFRRIAHPANLSSVSTAVLDDFAIARLHMGVAPATVNRDLRHVKAALNWAARRGLLERAPDFHGVFVREPKKKPVVMPEGDFLAIVAAAESKNTPVTRQSGDWWRTFLYLGYYLGLRRGELLALSWRDIDLGAKELKVLAPSSKGRKERVLPLSDAISRLLGDWHRRSGSPAGAAAVLPWDFDTFNPLYDDWRLLQDAAGIPKEQRYAPKNLRSSCASQMIASSIPTMVVKDFLGHAKVATTETYYVNTEPAMRAVANVREVKFNADRGNQGNSPEAESSV